MDVITIDFETYWDADHSLSKMPAITYCTDPKTQIISLGLKTNDQPTRVVFGEQKAQEALDAVDWGNALLIGHNLSAFDSMLLAWRFQDVHPKMWGCTAAMARPIHTKTTGNSLAKLVEYYGLGVKEQTVLHTTKGRRLEDFTAQERRDMAAYNAADVDQCYALFHKLRPHYTAKELWHIDASVRMLVESRFEVDTPLLEVALSVERDRKRKTILTLARHMRQHGLGGDAVTEAENLGDLEEAVRAALASAPKFSKLLESLDVPVPMKPSPTTPDKQVPALAKTDDAFIALQSHDNEVVAAAAMARLAVKSTLLETRIGAFMEAAAATGGYLPVPLNYCGADTTGRWSGWAYNPQNLPRIDPRNPKVSDALRNSLKAPRGHKIVVADQSGIELRVNHFLWKVPESMALYAQDRKADLYRAFAAARYGIAPDEVTKQQRQLAKVAHLGLGFGAGWRTFQNIAKIMGGLDLSDEEAESVTQAWRTQYAEIVLGWRTCHSALQDIYEGVERVIDPWGLCVTCKEGIRLPSGRVIRYPGLHTEPGSDSRPEWWYGAGRHRTRIYAGKIDENCIAEGTLVLTDSGWKPIEGVTPADRVHDGEEFVPHAGVVFKSVQPCITIDGVHMTADHEVLTNDGWKEASQVQGLYRPDLWGIDRVAPRGIHGQELAVAVHLPMRESDGQVGFRRCQGSQARRHSQLRVPDQAVDFCGEPHARDVQAPGVRRLARYAGSLSAAIAPRLGQLWRAWGGCMREVAGVVRELLGGYGRLLPAGSGLGAQRQSAGVLSRELLLGDSPGECHEPAYVSAQRGRAGAEPGYRYRADYAVQPGQIGVATGRTNPHTEPIKPVYDILNCGPRHRFVVLGTGGPFIVHNCIQALARDTIADNAVDFFRATGHRPQLMVHDELVYVLPEQEAQAALDTLQGIMRTPPTWWPQLVTESEGDIADSYGAAK